MADRLQVALTATPIGTGVEAGRTGLGAAVTVLSIFEHGCHTMVIWRHVGRRRDKGGSGDEESEGNFECVEAQHCD